MSVVSNNILAGASGQGGAGYQIERSLRFNPGDSAYLNRTPSSSGNLKTWTWSGWVKRSNSGAGHTNDFFSCGVNIHNGGAGGAQANAYFDVDGTIQVYEYSGGYGYNYRTTQVFRDFSAWYHIVISLDTTDLTAGDRVKIYINGDRVTSFSTSNAPTLNFEGEINKSGVQHYISDTAAPFNGYLADVHFIDGQALAPTDFGETDDNGVWQPKEFAGTYGPLVNQAQNWTNATTLSTGSWTGALANMFNGSLATAAYDSVSGATATITLSQSYSGLVRVYNGTMIGTVVLKNGSTTVATYTGLNTGVGWETVATSASSFNKIEITSSSGSVIALHGIEIGGNLLVDSGVTVADNSFHLPFTDNSSSAALGTDTSGNGNTWTVNNLTASTSPDYSLNVSGSISGSPYDATKMFDGSLTTFTDHNGQNTTFTWTYTLTSVTSLRVYVHGGSGTTTVTTVGGNGTQVDTIATNFGPGWHTISLSSTGSTINSIAFTRGGSGVFFSVYAIEVNSVVYISGGSHTDSLVDSPTNGTQTDTGAGGEVVGNYATLNPLLHIRKATLSNGNLEATGGSSTENGYGNMAVSSGKWYAEATVTAGGGSTNVIVGVKDIDQLGSTDFGAVSRGYGYSSSGQKLNSDSLSSYAASYTNGDVIGIALDLDGGTITFYKNGSTQGQAFSGISSSYSYHFCSFCRTTSDTIAWNFGQRAFAYNAPSGYKALCTSNLPEPTIADGSKYFNTSLWTGNGTQTTVSGLEFSPSFVWIKSRSTAAWHMAFDVIRGVQARLHPNEANQEQTGNNDLTAFNSDGYTLDNNSAPANTDVNGSGTTYAGWAWDAGSSNTTIAAGSLNSSVYNQSDNWSTRVTGTPFSGYSIATMFDGSISALCYANTGSSLTFTPTTPIPVTSSIRIYGSQTSSTEFIKINDNAATNVPSNAGWFTPDTGTAITSLSKLEFYTTNGSYASGVGAIEIDGKLLVDSSVSITTPSIASTVRANPSAGFSIVSYTGTSSDASVAHGLNAEPEFIIIKNRTTSGYWVAGHTSIGWDKGLYLNTTNAQVTAAYFGSSPSITANTFSIGTASGLANANGDDFIAYCFAPVEGYSAMGSFLATGSADSAFVFTGFRPRWILGKATSTTFATGDWFIYDTERETFNSQSKPIGANTSNVEDSGGYYYIDVLSNGFKIRGAYDMINKASETYIYLAFAEHPFKTARAR